MAASFTQLKGLENKVGEFTLTDILRASFISFFEWGLLEKQNFFNVRLDDTGAYGGDKSRLRLVNDPYFNKGQVWEGFRHPWVWQSGLSVTPSPIKVSGVYVNDTFHDLNTTGNFAHHIDYSQGRIVFDSAISQNSTVQAEFSYPWINVIDGKDIPFLRHTQFRSLRVDDSHFLQDSSGDWNILGRSRSQLPVLAFEVSPRRSFSPYQLGGGQWSDSTIFAHGISEDEMSASRIADVVSSQNDKTIFMFDVTEVANKNRFPLNLNGSIASGALTYPQMIKQKEFGGFRWRKARIFNTEIVSNEQIHTNLWHSQVRMTVRVGLPEI